MFRDNSLVVDIRAAQQGDSGAWDRLFLMYRPALQSWAGRFRVSGEMSEHDLIQEAWIHVFNGIGRFNGVDSNRSDEMPIVFYKWLRVTARHAMLTRIKYSQAAKRHPEKPIVRNEDFELTDHQIRTPSSIVEGDEQAEHLRVAIADLPEFSDRQIISMSFEDNLSLRAIASILNKDYATIRRRFHFLLRRLEYVLTKNPNKIEKDD